MNRTLIVLAAFLLTVPASLHAANVGKLSGIVFDSSNDEPLVAANVSLVGTHLGAVTNEDGMFYIINLEPGDYEIQIDYIGYRSKVIQDITIYINKTTFVEVAMEATVLEGERVIVESYRESKVDPYITSTRFLYSNEDVANTAGIRSVEDLLSLQADAVGGQIRSGRLGEINYILDGISIVDPYMNQSTFSPLIEAIEQTEIITSGFGAEYGKAMSGVVNMVMREGPESWYASLDLTNDIPRNPLHANIYSPEENDHWRLLNEPLAWLDSLNGKILYTYLTSTHELVPRSDTVNAYLAFLDYRLFYDRMGDEYKNTDTRLSFNAGGPVADRLKLFIAGTMMRDWEPIPYYRPLHDYQLMGNLAFKMDATRKIKFLYTRNFNSRALRNVGWSRSNLWSTTYNMTLAEWETDRFGLQYSHIIDKSSYAHVNLTYQASSHHESLPLVQRREHSARITPSSGAFRPPSWETGGGALPSRHLAQTNDVLSLDASVGYQITYNHLLKGGVQFESYRIKENFDTDWTKAGQGAWRKYSRYPIDGALYLQDQMEFEGMIANVGLRWDFYNYRTKYYADIYSPIRNPNYDSTVPYVEREPLYDKDLAAMDSTKLIHRLQPRVGLSFPVSENSIFHFNYGQFFQRPGFRYIYYFTEELSGEVREIGNPRLKPEVTTQYDVGVVNALPGGFVLDVSGYYKYVANLIEQAIYTDAGLKQYSTFENRDYAKILGFYFNIGQRGQNIGFDIKYNWEEAKGKTSSRTEEPTIYKEDEGQPGTGVRVKVPPADDVLLDFDRTHKMVAHLYVNTKSNWGPSLLGFRPLSRLNMNCNFILRSGRPYTDDKGLTEGTPFNNRLSMENDLRIRISKSFFWGRQDITLYMEGFNLLNYKEYDYQNLFNSFTHRQTLIGLEEGTVDKYPAEYTGPYTWTDPAYTYNIYGTPPRYFRWGVRINFF